MSIYDAIANAGGAARPVESMIAGQDALQARERNRQVMEIAAATEQRAQQAQEIAVRESQRAEATQKFETYRQAAATMLHWDDTLKASGVPDDMRAEIIRGKYQAVTQSLGIDINDPQFEQFREPSRALFESVIETADSALKKLHPELATDDSPMSVKEWQFYQSLPPDQQPRYLEMKRSDKLTTVAGVPTLVGPGGATTPLSTPAAENAAQARAAAATTVGEAAGKAEASLPAAAQDVQTAIDTLEQLRVHPGLGYAVGKSSYLPVIRGTDAADFMALQKQATGQVFLRAYAVLRGAGAITEKEGEKAEQAVARIGDTGQTEEAYKAGIVELEGIIRSGYERMRQQAAQGHPTGEGMSAGGDVAPSTALPAGGNVVDWNDL